MRERQHPTEEERRALRETERSRLLAAVFGDVLPDGTSDERSESGGEPAAEASDEWLRKQVPPHHG